MNKIVNKQKLIFIPAIIIFAAILFAGVVSYNISKQRLMDQLKQDGFNYAGLLSQKIETQSEHMELILEMLEEKIKLAAHVTLAHKRGISNELLAEIADAVGVDELLWFSPQGEILYSASGDLIGWRCKEGGPIDRFIKSGEAEYVEGIRKSSESDDHFKYAYIKDDSGFFVQSGIRAEEVYRLTEKHSLQNIVEEVAQENNILYALVIDKNFVAIADSDTEEIGVSYLNDQDYTAALQGTPSAVQWYYDRVGKDVIEIATPLFLNGEIIGVVAVGLSMENIFASLLLTGVVFSLVGGAVFLAFCWAQSVNIIKPIIRLEEQIHLLEINPIKESKLAYPKGDTFEGLYITINDLLERTYSTIKLNKNLSHTIEHLAYHDHLTDLPNRTVFLHSIEESFKKGQAGAVLMLDIDNFKDINDSFGHAFGDEVLKNISHVLRKFVNQNITVYRFGGDEFLFHCAPLANKNVADQLAADILKEFEKRLSIGGDEEIYVRCSIGVALYPQDSTDINDLIVYSDLAMYSAKKVLKNSYMFYNNEMAEQLQERNIVEKTLRRALNEDGFTLLYQPKVCASSYVVTGFEALIRIKDSTISPNQFIPIAEETGMINEIGRWVTRQAVWQLKLWQEEKRAPKPISVNFSAKQLYDLDYVEFLEKLIAESGINPSLLEVEITENLLIGQEVATIVFLNKLKEIGVRISLDDFGKGYSSLNYLTYLPVDLIKLDKSLCDKYQEPVSMKVINSIIGLANSLDLQVVAEGIETKEQLSWFESKGCHYIQGYLFSKPLPISAAVEMYDLSLRDKIL